MKNQYELPCNIAQTLNIIGDKWTLLIVHEIMLGDKSYNEILSKLAGIASNLDVYKRQRKDSQWNSR